MSEERTLFKILTEILDELSKEDFNKFQYRLMSRDDDKKISHSCLKDASREDTIKEMISHFSSGALDITREILDVIQRKDLTEELMTKAEALQETSRRLLRKPKRRETGGAVIQLAAGVVIGVVSVAAAGAATSGAPLAMSVAGAVFGGGLILNGIRSLFTKEKDT